MKPVVANSLFKYGGFFHAVVPVVLSALVYDERRGSYSVGRCVCVCACVVCVFVCVWCVCVCMI